MLISELSRPGTVSPFAGSLGKTRAAPPIMSKGVGATRGPEGVAVGATRRPEGVGRVTGRVGRGDTAGELTGETAGDALAEAIGDGVG